MKKFITLGTVLAAGIIAANAQTTAYERTNFGSNWSIGLQGGAATPMTGHAFFGDMRGVVGAKIHKQISPTFGLGVDAQFGVNTSSWAAETKGVQKSRTAFDNSYLGVYGTANLFNLFAGYRERVFDMDVVAGAGWGHNFNTETTNANNMNYFSTRAGLSLNFHPSQHWTISIEPGVMWAMTNSGKGWTSYPGRANSCYYNIKNAGFQILAGVTYNFGPGFKSVRAYDQAEVDGLNARINALRGDLDASAAAIAATQAQNAALATELAACQNRAPQVVTQTSNTLTSVRYVFYKVGSSKITPDQMPNVEMVAAYMKNHPESKVVVKGYASPDGNYDFNVKLAAARAESVKTALVQKYGIKADRIKAEGEGIGNMFAEESWNRVSICTIDD